MIIYDYDDYPNILNNSSITIKRTDNSNEISFNIHDMYIINDNDFYETVFHINESDVQKLRDFGLRISTGSKYCISNSFDDTNKILNNIPNKYYLKLPFIKISDELLFEVFKISNKFINKSSSNVDDEYYAQIGMLHYYILEHCDFFIKDKKIDINKTFVKSKIYYTND